MGLIGLPSNLGIIADAAEQSTAGPTRFEVRSVEIAVIERKRQPSIYRVAATDLRALAVVEGDLPDVGNIDGLEPVRTADSSATRALVRACEFKKVFAEAARLGRKSGRGVVLTALGKSAATFGCSDETPGRDSEHVHRTELDKGQFPWVADTVARSTKDEPVAKVSLDAEMLADLARIAANFGEQVTIEFRPEGRPLVMRTANSSQRVTLIASPATANADEAIHNVEVADLEDDDMPSVSACAAGSPLP